jgi:hypothetical protein
MRGWAFAARVLLPVALARAYSARDGLYGTYLRSQPEAQAVGKAAYAAGERSEDFMRRERGRHEERRMEWFGWWR